MRAHSAQSALYHQPQLLPQASQLANYLKSLPVAEIARIMKLSAPMAAKTQALMRGWTTDPNQQLPAIDAFIGDIYSGLQVQSLTPDDRAYANQHLYILSGLYGVLRALDSICPYRLEMGYRFGDEPFRNLYRFWHDAIASLIPTDQLVINLSSEEYTKAVLPHLPNSTIVAPKFMTKDPRSGEPKFVVVHAKIARGAFARWLIQSQIETVDDLPKFSELGYQFNAQLSTTQQPVFVCSEFSDLGLSVRLS